MSRSSKEEISLKLRTSSDVLSIISKLRTRSISSIPELKAKDILVDQDFDKYIFDLRENLLNRVFDGIQQSFIEHNKVKFVVECAYESWKNIICLNFFFHSHCDEYCQKNSSWRPDLEPEISPPDSWCRGNISMKKREFLIEEEKTDTVLSDYQLIKVENYPKQNYFQKPVVDAKKFEKGESFQELYSPHPRSRKDIQMSILNASFELMVTSPASSDKMDESIIINKISDSTSDEDTAFYKNIKRTEMDMPCAEKTSEFIILPRKRLGSFTREEENWKKKYDKKITFPPLRMNAMTSIKGRTNTLSVGRSGRYSTNFRGSSVEFSYDGYLKSQSSFKFYQYSL